MKVIFFYVRVSAIDSTARTQLILKKNIKQPMDLYFVVFVFVFYLLHSYIGDEFHMFSANTHKA